MVKRKQTMSFSDAMSFVDDDMPDGAFFAMAHEIAGLEYGDGFDELFGEEIDETPPLERKFKCIPCRKRFARHHDLEQHARDTGHKPVQCTHCNKPFKDMAAMQEHARAKHPMLSAMAWRRRL